MANHKKEWASEAAGRVGVGTRSVQMCPLVWKKLLRDVFQERKCKTNFFLKGLSEELT